MLHLSLLIFFITGIVSLRCRFLPSQPLSSPVSSCLLCPINVTLKEVLDIRWHIPAMDHLCPTPSQMLFQSSRTTSSFLRMTIVASPSGVKIFTVFPYNIFACHCLSAYMDNKNTSSNILTHKS